MRGPSDRLAESQLDDLIVLPHALTHVDSDDLTRVGDLDRPFVELHAVDTVLEVRRGAFEAHPVSDPELPRIDAHDGGVDV